MCVVAFEGERGGSRKRERSEEAEGRLIAEGEGGWRMVMAAGGQEIQHKHRRSLSDITMPTALLSPRGAPVPPVDIESVLGVYQRGGVKAAGTGFPSPTKAVSAGLFRNGTAASAGVGTTTLDSTTTGQGEVQFPKVRSTFWRSAAWNGIDGNGLMDGNGGKNGVKMGSVGLSSLGNGTGMVSSAGKTMTTSPASRNVRAPLRSLLIVRPSSMASLEVASPRSRLRMEASGMDPDEGGGVRYRVPLSPLAVRREASGAIRGVGRVGVQLDLGAVARSCDSSGGEMSELQVRRDKLAFFDKQCSRVADHIYLGSDAVARNRETLRAAGITHVLNCVGFVCSEYFSGDLSYKTLWLQDTPGEDIMSILYDVFDYFEDVREKGGRVFVHCCQGVSRSTALVIAYLMWKDGRTYDDAFRDVKAARGVTNPNMGFACQLLQWQKRVLGVGAGGGGGARLYRIAPHSLNDPLHLVHKAVTKPSRDVLDTRGAFLLLGNSGLFLWRGRECSAVIASAGENAAKKVMRYEKVRGPVHIVKEGEESMEFLAALGGVPSASPGGGRSNGNRVLSYSLDYEAIAKARSSAGWRAGGEPLLGSGCGTRPSGWNEMSSAAKEHCNGGRSSSSASTSSDVAVSAGNGRGKIDWGEHQGISNEGVDRGGTMVDEKSSVRRCGTGTAEGRADGGCSTPSGGNGGMGKGKRAERRGEERENGAKALRREIDGGPESPTMSQRRFESGDATMADFGRRGSGEVGERVESVDSTAAGVSGVADALSVRQVLVEEWLETTRTNGSETKGARGAAAAVEEEKATTRSADVAPAVPRLFEWPAREEMRLFDTDDLQPTKVYVLWVSNLQREGGGETNELIVWVGSECGPRTIGGNHESEEEGEKRGSRAWQRRWWRVADEFRSWKSLSAETGIQVVEEGKEPDEFWAYFIHG